MLTYSMILAIAGSHAMLLPGLAVWVIYFGYLAISTFLEYRAWARVTEDPSSWALFREDQLRQRQAAHVGPRGWV